MGNFIWHVVVQAPSAASHLHFWAEVLRSNFVSELLGPMVLLVMAFFVVGSLFCPGVVEKEGNKFFDVWYWNFRDLG